MKYGILKNMWFFHEDISFSSFFDNLHFFMLEME